MLSYPTHLFWYYSAFSIKIPLYFYDYEKLTYWPISTGRIKSDTKIGVGVIHREAFDK